jgi:glycerol-3-phosphate dehydrogenase
MTRASGSGNASGRLTPASTSLNAARRTAELEALGDGEVVDVVVIGGGVTGAGVALDCATRGLSVALLERRDLAHGTSRWSSKLVHGGLRYLESHDVELAWESARERAILMRHTAPHLIRALPFVIGLDDGMDGRKAAKTRAGLRVGDTLRAASGLRSRDLPASRSISAHEARRLAPALRSGGLRGTLLNWDGQLEDDARLVVAIARTAAAHGARILTYVEVDGLDSDGVDAHDVRTGERLRVRARHVVVAAGVWSGALTPAVELRPSKGSHVLVSAERLGDPRAAVTVPVPGERSRWVFSIPRGDGLVTIGLTDAAFDGPIPDEPSVDPAEEAELLSLANRALDVPLTSADVVGGYAGLRPLLAGDGGATADLSRRHAVLEDPDTRALTVVGGKLTTYRRMAQDVTDRIAGRTGVVTGRCRTARLGLVGSGGDAFAHTRLVRRYGSEAAAVIAMADGRPELLEPLAPGAGVCGAELRFALDHELALTLDDLLDRRTRLGLAPARRAAALDPAREAVPELAGWLPDGFAPGIRPARRSAGSPVCRIACLPGAP